VDSGISVESIDHDSNASECGANGGTWVDGTIYIGNTSYNSKTGLFNVVSFNGGSLLYATFQSGALFGPTGGLSDGNTACYGDSCGGAGFTSVSINWLSGQMVAGSMSGYAHWLACNGANSNGCSGSQVALTTTWKHLLGGLSGSNNYCGPNGAGAPMNSNDWACSMHDYNMHMLGNLHIFSRYSSSLGILQSGLWTQANQNLVNSVTGYSGGVISIATKLGNIHF
jgi:hypothetical protein